MFSNNNNWLCFLLYKRNDHNIKRLYLKEEDMAKDRNTMVSSNFLIQSCSGKKDGAYDNDIVEKVELNRLRWQEHVVRKSKMRMINGVMATYNNKGLEKIKVGVRYGQGQKRMTS